MGRHDPGTPVHTYVLLGPDGHPYRSRTPGALAGHSRSRLYGRLDCRARRRAIDRGATTGYRVFFADETAAVAAGFRPCAVCLPDEYHDWKQTTQQLRPEVAPTVARAVPAPAARPRGGRR